MEEMISTPMGAELIIHDAPEHLGRGVLLTLRMNRIADSRRADVFLDQKATEALCKALKAHSERLRTYSSEETHV